MTDQPKFQLVDGGGAADRYAVYAARVNLNQTGYAPMLDVRSWRAMSVSVMPDDTWSTAVIEAKWTADQTGLPSSLVPQCRLTGSSSSRQSVDVSTVPYIRFWVTTAEGSNRYAIIRVFLTR